jgi:quercetin dioxygenase-like cupin family protein
MSRVHATILIGFVAITIALVGDGQVTVGGGGFSELHRAEVVGASNLEVVMGFIERPAESISGKHYHPGGEFGFVLEGAITVSTEDEPEVTLRMGDSFYQPPGKGHGISTTAEGTRGVVFRVLKKGQPMVVGVE